jgi:hypothetical protein
MSERINIRLPDGLYTDLKAFVEREGVALTDVVIAGINEQIYNRAEKPIVSKKEDLPVALKAAVEKKVAAGGYFHPMPKGKK